MSKRSKCGSMVAWSAGQTDKQTQISDDMDKIAIKIDSTCMKKWESTNHCAIREVAACLMFVHNQMLNKNVCLCTVYTL